MGFITKINLSENRLIKQTINTWTQFHGMNEFSVPMNERILGGDYSEATKTLVDQDIISTFKYNTLTNILEVTFGNPLMETSSKNIPLIDFNDPYISYDVPPVLIGSEPYVIDGVTFYNKYDGYEYDLTINDIEYYDDLIVGEFITGALNYVDAPSLDYKGDGVVLKVNGAITADKFISTNNLYKIETISSPTTINNSQDVDLFILEDEMSFSKTLPIGFNIKLLLKNGFKFNFNEHIINEVSIAEGQLIEIIKINNNEFYIKQ